MNIERKIERIKTEIAFLAEGVGTIEEITAAFTEVTEYAAGKLVEAEARLAEDGSPVNPGDTL